MLIDYDKNTAYIPVALEFLIKLREEWSEPVQVRLIGDDLTFRHLERSIGRAYIARDDEKVLAT